MNWPIFSGIWILSPSLSEKKEKEKTLSELDLCGKNFWIAVFVKIPFQHINYPYMLRICRQNFMKFKDR